MIGSGKPDMHPLHVTLGSSHSDYTKQSEPECNNSGVIAGTRDEDTQNINPLRLLSYISPPVSACIWYPTSKKMTLLPTIESVLSESHDEVVKEQLVVLDIRN